jgi:hypothetical protein
MALYIPAGRRRRRLLLVAGAAAVAGLVIGVAVGRASAPKPADEAAEAKRSVARITGLLGALRLHYGDVVEGRGDATAFQASLDDAVRRSGTELDNALANAPWLDPPVQEALHRDVDEVGAAAARRVPAAEFEARVDAVVAELKQRFGAPAVGAVAAASTSTTAVAVPAASTSTTELVTAGGY